VNLAKQVKSTRKDARARKIAKTKPSIVRTDVGANSMWDAVKRLFTR
jgi:hypothetical protein